MDTVPIWWQSNVCPCEVSVAVMLFPPMSRPPLGWEVTPQHWWVVLLPLTAEVPCFGLHPHLWELDLLSAKSCSCGCTVGRWGSLRCVLWSLKSMWGEGKVSYILGKYLILVLPRKCLAVVWWTPRSDGRALAAEGSSEVCAAENSHPGMRRILWALIN